MEYAIFFPLVVILVLFLIQIAWIGFQSASFEYATRSATWNFDVDQAKNAPDLDAFVVASVVDTKAPLDVSQLSAAGMSLGFSPIDDESETNGPDDRTLYHIERVSRQGTYAHLSGTISYRIGFIVPLPGFSGINLVKTVDTVRLLASLFEVS